MFSVYVKLSIINNNISQKAEITGYIRRVEWSGSNHEVALRFEKVGDPWNTYIFLNDINDVIIFDSHQGVVHSRADRPKVVLRLKLAKKGDLSDFECDMLVCTRQAGLSPSITLIGWLRFQHMLLSGSNKTEENVAKVKSPCWYQRSEMNGQTGWCPQEGNKQCVSI